MNVSEEQVWAYLTGELDEATAQEVAEAIRSDKALQALVAQYEKLLQGFRSQRLQRYANEALEVLDTTSKPMDEPVEQAHPKQAPQKTFKWWHFLTLALGILIIWYALRPNTATRTDIASTYFRLPADPAIAGSTTANAFADGLEAFYTNKNYAVAINLWHPLRSDSLYGPSANFYLGHAYFMNGQYAEAQQQFKRILAVDSTLSLVEEQDVRWNLLLTDFVLGEKINKRLQELPSTPQRDELLEVVIDFTNINQ